jgi:hypothetical protein
MPSITRVTLDDAKAAGSAPKPNEAKAIARRMTKAVLMGSREDAS